jgi:hypothetical protein
MKFATILLLAMNSTILSAGPITILSVTGGTPAVPFGLYNLQTLAISFTTGQAYSNVSISADVFGSFSGSAYLMTQIGVGTTVADEIASSPFTSTGLAFLTVLQNVSIGPGTYFLVLGNPQPVNGSGWQTGEANVMTVADVGASTPFGVYSSFTDNAFAPSDSFVFESLPGTSTVGGTPYFTILGTASGTASPEPATWTLLGIAFVSLLFCRQRPAQR